MDQPRSLSRENLSTYLNDHVAGSVTALELLEHQAKNNSGTPLEDFFANLHVEITADQQVLRDLMRALQIEEGAIRKAGAWMVEKAGRVKLALSNEEAGGAGFLQALEGLALGITGKQLLWRSLAAAEEKVPQLHGPDYARLEQRAAEQCARVEVKRLAAARAAFTRPNE